jgi:hypothetical protein
MLMDKERLPSLSSFSSRVSMALAHMSQLPLDARIFPLDANFGCLRVAIFTLGCNDLPLDGCFRWFAPTGSLLEGKKSNTKVDSEGNFHLE